MRRLFLLYAILIFAKKAPDMLKKLLNMKDDNIGLKGLNIKNKMGEAALVGKHVKKGMTGIEGRAKGAVGGALGGLRAGGGIKGTLKSALQGKDALKANLMEKGQASAAGISKGFAKGKHDALQNGDTKGIFSGSYKDMGNIASGGRTSFFGKPKDLLNQGDDKVTKAFGRLGGKYADPQGGENQLKLNGLKADLTKRYGADKANEMLKRGYVRLEDKFGEGNVDLSNEAQFMYLTAGKVWDNKKKKYVSADLDAVKKGLIGQNEIYDGLKHAVDYSGKTDDYWFDGAVHAEMNTAYRYSNISADIDKKRSGFDTAYQKYMQAEASGIDSSAYKATMESAFKKYGEALQTANDAGLIQVSISNGKINDKSLKEFVANTDLVDTNLSKQVAALKENTDSMMQKEEIKQQQNTDEGKK